MATAPRIPRSNLAKCFSALGFCVLHPGRALRALARGLAAIYQEQVAARSPLPQVRLRDLVGRDTDLRLADYEGRNGNVSLYELTVIAALVRHRQPRVMLEIGTFDGNTALQMALNSPEDARVYTLDLPLEPAAAEAAGVARAGGSNATAAGQLDPHDLTYITDQQKLDRRYQHHDAGRKVVQCLGDSATFDFHSTLEHGRPELVFIDGSHSFDYVKNDTVKVLDLVAPGGVILWHDYVPAWPGVIEYLSDLGQRMPLLRIANTSLVYLDTSSLVTEAGSEASAEEASPELVSAT